MFPLLTDSRAFSHLVFLLLPSKVDGDPDQCNNHHSCSHTTYEQGVICSHAETQKSHEYKFIRAETGELVFTDLKGSSLLEEATVGHVDVTLLTHSGDSAGVN